jgi:hypothetical protein
MRLARDHSRGSSSITSSSMPTVQGRSAPSELHSAQRGRSETTACSALPEAGSGRGDVSPRGLRPEGLGGTTGLHGVLVPCAIGPDDERGRGRHVVRGAGEVVSASIGSWRP